MTLRQTIEACRHEISIADPHADAVSLILSLLCLQFARQRDLISAVQNRDQACLALNQLRDRGLPIPQTWLHPPLFSTALFDRLATLTDSIERFAQVYELLQLPDQQRAQGVFYTPIEIADYIVEQAIQSQAIESTQTILDPACGGGVFLLRAYAKLLSGSDDTVPQARDTVPGALRDRFDLLQRCIFGVDVDPVAVAIAQIALLLQAIEGVSAPSCFPDLAANVGCGNAVIEPRSPILQRQYDVVIGNPPYLDAERMTLICPDWRHYCTQHYRSARGNWDLFCVFIEQGLNLCRSSGITSMIVPNKLISADYATEARSLLCQENQLLSIRDYSQQRIFAAAVYPIVFVAKKQSPTRSATIRYERMSEFGGQETHWLTSDRFSPHRPWLLSPARSPLIQLQNLPTWESIAQIHGAATVSEAYALQPFLTEAQPKDTLRFVNSGTIDRYGIRWGEKPLRYLGKVFDRPVVRLPIDPCLHKRLWQARQPKLIVAGMTRQLEGAIDRRGEIWAGKSTCIIRSDVDLRYLLGLINSRVVNFYFSHLFQGNQLQGGYLRVGAKQLRSLPLPPDDPPKRDRLIAIVQMRLDATIDTKIAELERQIEQLVCELYHLTDGAIVTVQSL